MRKTRVCDLVFLRKYLKDCRYFYIVFLFRYEFDFDTFFIYISRSLVFAFAV